MLRATSGKATIFGKDVWRDAVDIHKRVAYVPGDVSFWPNLTGGEVIDLFLNLRGIKERKKSRELMERFQFDPTKKRSEEHTSELQSRGHLVCRLLLEKKK